MKHWVDGVLSKLAGNLKAQILIFGVLIVIVLALLGGAITSRWEVLVYIVVIGAMLVFVFERLLDAWERTRASKSGPHTTVPPVTEPQTTVPPALPRMPLDDLRRCYLENIIEDCRKARLIAFDPQAADPRRGAFALDQLYIHLDTRTPVQRDVPESNEGLRLADKRERPLSVLEALLEEKDRRMVLLGLPGSGKSTFARYLALRHAQALCDPSIDIAETLAGWKGPALIPVLVSLGRFAEGLPSGAQRGSAEQILSYLSEILRSDERACAYGEQLSADLEYQGGLFLFDGLDEVADLDLRPVVVQAVEDFARRFGKHPRSRFLVSCRTFSYTDPRWQLSGWASHELAAFTLEKIHRFVNAWHAELIHADPARRDDYEDKRKNLLAALQPNDRRRLIEIADNPLILTVMAVVHTNKSTLPDARALVYEQCIDLLLLQWEAERTVTGGKSKRSSLLDALGVPDIQLNKALQEVAYKAHSTRADGARGDRSALVTNDLLTGVLYAFFQDAARVQTFLNYCESANGLLLKQGVAPLPDSPPDSPPRAVYTFPHLTFQEYLAARYLRRLPNLDRAVRSHLDAGDRWREVIVLLAEHLCFREGDQGLMDAILNALAPQELPSEMRTQDWRALWMAADLLLLYRRALGSSPCEARVQTGLRRLLEAGALTARERASAGDALAELGDPRFDPQIFFLPADETLGFVRIPAGPFQMGSDKTADPQAFDDELPQHEVTLPEFYLARCPVTVAQFDQFIQAGGYAEARYWPEARQAGLWAKGLFQDRNAPRDFGRPFNLPNHPAVGVAWYEALAYCRWLDERLKALAPGRVGEPALPEAARSFWQALAEGRLAVTLPSEAEWEKAARPAAQAAYPWGNAFDPEKANTEETRLNTTSAVGCFPAGAGPYGHLDLSGNVWEWTRSLFAEYPYPDDSAGRAQREHLGNSGPRVWRGGSFIDFARYARCACRGRVVAYVLNSSLGVRAGVSPLPLGSGSSGSLEL